MAFRTGDRVHQPTYGVGEIIATSSPYVTIAFDDGMTRKFVASMVLLEPSFVPRPSKPEPAARRRKKSATEEGRVAGTKGTA
jgi:hypothetical protein